MPGDRTTKLTRAAIKALGKASPELFKLRFGDCLAAATEDDHYEPANALVRWVQWGEALDPVDVLVTIDDTNPIDLANWMAEANPGLDLGHPERMPTLEVLKAALRMLVGHDPFAGDRAISPSSE